MGFPITITNAGLAKLINVQNTGTAARQITQIGVTSSAFTPTSSMTALPGEIKRLSTFGGSVVASDTIHVSLRDDSADTYTMRGFALYLDDGTMLAVYGQSTPIMEKSAASMVLLAGDIKFTQVSATTLSFGSTNWINPPATDAVHGVVELATPAESNAGTDTTRAVTPEGLKYTNDQRLGVGNPSTFMKGILGAATAAALKISLGIKAAANFDTGTGNGLDADLLDGNHGAYYLQWSNLQGVPSTFTPGAHNHTWANITGAPETATRWPSWGEVSGKPGTFTPSAHSHDAGDIVSGTFPTARIPGLPITHISGLQGALDSKATLNASVSFGDVTANRFLSSNGAVGEKYRVGDDGAIHDVGIANTIGVVGLQNAGVGYISFGNSGNCVVGFNGGTFVLNGYTIWHAGVFDPNSKSNVGHGHGISEISGLQGALDGKAANGHGHTIANVSGLQGALDGKSNNGHGHSIAEVSGLQGTLDGKANLSGASFSGEVAAPSFNRTSDRRRKKAIAPLTNCLATVCRILPREFEWRASGSWDTGYIAQELQQVLPHAVCELGISEDEDTLLGVRLDTLSPYLVGAVQELLQIIEKQDVRIRKLERS